MCCLLTFLWYMGFCHMTELYLFLFLFVIKVFLAFIVVTWRFWISGGIGALSLDWVRSIYILGTSGHKINNLIYYIRVLKSVSCRPRWTCEMLCRQESWRNCSGDGKVLSSMATSGSQTIDSYLVFRRISDSTLLLLCIEIMS